MTILLAKDLRLSLDALRPWALIVLGFGLVALLSSFLPRSVMPINSGITTVSELVATIGGLAGITCVATAAWIAASVSHGELRHGAALLHGTLPVGGRGRVLSKAAAILAGTLAVAIVSILLRGEFTATLSSQRGVPGLPPAWVLVSAIVGAGFGMGIAAATRAIFPTVMIALLIAVGAALAGAGGAAVAIPFAAAQQLAVAHVMDPTGSVSEISEMQVRIATAGAAVGVCVAAILAALIGLRAFMGPIPVRRAALLLALTVVASLLGGAVAAPIALANDSINQWQPYVDRGLILASDATVIEAIGRVGQHLRTDPASLDIASGDARFVAIAQSRLSRLPVSERASHPLAIALHEAEFYDELRAAIWSLRLIPRDARSRGDHRYLETALHVAIRYRDAQQIQRLLDIPVAAAGGWTMQPTALPEMDAADSSYDGDFDRQLIRRLRTLREDPEYAALRELMDQVRENLERQLPAGGPG